jgi:hypothetical protein
LADDGAGQFDVPVALVSCPHFYVALARAERLTGWNRAQFVGRVGHMERLPERLAIADLLAVARVIFPAGDADTLAKLANCAARRERHWASMEAVVKRARWLAFREGRTEATAADVTAAFGESATPDTPATAQSPHGGCAQVPLKVRGVFAEGFARGTMGASRLAETQKPDSVWWELCTAGGNGGDFLLYASNMRFTEILDKYPAI